MSLLVSFKGIKDYWATRKPRPDEYKCPVLVVHEPWDVYVDKLYCDSFCRGLGCNRKDVCEAYGTPEAPESSGNPGDQETIDGEATGP